MQRSRLVGRALTIPLLLVVAASAMTFSRAAPPPAQAVEPTAATSGGAGEKFGSFQVVCTPSHTASDDPIVYPRQPGAAHRHEFFGNTSTNAFSTTSSLSGKPTTCAVSADRAAYWIPTLSNDGRRVEPDRVIAYYRTGQIVDAASIRAFPQGLRMIAGDGHASRPQPTGIVNWACGDGIAGTARPPASCPTKPLRLRIEFPNCWDGRNLDSADHQSHLAYSWTDGDRTCPRTHPVEVPSLQLNFRWHIAGSLDGVALSSGGVLTGHGDFWNTWNQPALVELVERCLHGAITCESPPLR